LTKTNLTSSIEGILSKCPDPDLFMGLSEGETMNWISYLYARPKPETSRLNSRGHIINLYDPFARRTDFAAGRRWCVNVYTGCAFSCTYCYIISYIPYAFAPRIKKDFQRLLQKDLDELRKLALHPAPVHISNSTDPLQPLEAVHGHTLFLLQKLQEYREHFTTITLLTKNPLLLCRPRYLQVIEKLTDLHVQVTCPFFTDKHRRFFEPHAPRIENRLQGIAGLRDRGIDVAVRMDPVFPRDPLPLPFFRKSRLIDYGIEWSQTQEDIEKIISFAARAGCSKIIVSPLKLVTGRFGPSPLLPLYRELFTAANNGRIIKKGASFRLPWELFQYWIKAPSATAQELGLELVFCKKNLLTTS
jgi:DNA repair photolyase